MALHGKAFSSTNGTDPNWRIGIIHSTYHQAENAAMVETAMATLINEGIGEANITLHPVLGSFEIPLVGAVLAEAQQVNALIGFGVVLQGETPHAQYIVGEVARAVMDTQLKYSTPFAFEVLHVNSLEQAKARVSGEGSAGEEAAQAVLHSLAELNRIRSLPA